MKYVKAALTNEIPAGGKKKTSVEGKDVLLTNIDGAFYAVDNTCTHMGGSLYEGKLDGKHIVCPKHGSVFDVTTGKAVQAGKLLFMKVKIRDLQRYTVKTEGDTLLVGID